METITSRHNSKILKLISLYDEKNILEATNTKDLNAIIFRLGNIIISKFVILVMKNL